MTSHPILNIILRENPLLRFKVAFIRQDRDVEKEIESFSIPRRSVRKIHAFPTLSLLATLGN